MTARAMTAPAEALHPHRGPDPALELVEPPM